MVGSNLANVGNFNADNGPNVNDWNRDNHNVNLATARWVVSSRKRGFKVSSAWWILSSHQASCLLLAGLIAVLDILYWLVLECLCSVLGEFLEDLI